MISKKKLTTQISSLYNTPQQLQQLVETTPICPEGITSWLGRLQLLKGVPINYLVPDERMLPPESIRFFQLDNNWMAALLDGAFSIGRNLTESTQQPSVSLKIDAFAHPEVNRGTLTAAAAIRSNSLGLPADVVSFEVISGFILRSSLVQSCPGLGVNPYPLGATPSDPYPEALKILRMERLGEDTDTLICLVEGEVYRIDIHEAPEALHYGVDSFSVSGDTITSSKTVYPFSSTGPDDNRTVTMDMENPKFLDLAATGCFRTSKDNRTVKMESLATLIGQQQTPVLPSIDASQMGFEMIEGVGMVSFYNNSVQSKISAQNDLV
jgi:hypothetical protein